MNNQEVSLYAIEVIEEAGYEAFAYSGRGMYNSQCVSIHLNEGESLWDVASDIGLCLKEDESLSSIFPDTRTDSLGLGQVIYWPGLAWPEDQDET